MGPSPVKEAFAGRPAKLMCEMAFLPGRKVTGSFKPSGLFPPALQK